MSEENKQFVFGDADNGQSVVTVFDGGQHHDPDEGFARPIYGYKITTDAWEFSAADIYGDQQETSNLDLGAQSLFAFLHQCVREENDMFPVNVRVWASRYIEEIAILGTPDEEVEINPVMTLQDGVLVESEEDSVRF